MMSSQNKNILIKNISQIVTFDEEEQFTVIENGDILINKGKISEVGKNIKSTDCETIDGSGKTALPGLIDCHTHFIFSGTREDEFEMKIRGVPYLEIAKKGGGILNTVRKVRNASKEELVKEGCRRLDSFLQNGVTTVEVKSGYGLSTESEIKMLEAADEVNKLHSVDVVPTFLGAHVVPEEFKGKTDKYVDLVVKEMIPEVADKKLAEFCDVFLEEGAFNYGQTRLILETGKKYGLIPKLHSDQFSSIGGVKLAVELEAASVDHLDAISEEDIKILAKSDVIGVFLPGAVFFLGQKKYVPARKLIGNNVKYALSTDFNPGSCMTENLILIGSIACTQLKMLPSECIKAVTLNAAKAVNRFDIGNIKTGLKADIVLFNCDNYRYPFYHFGINHVDTVIKNGKILLADGELIKTDLPD
ncbi:imidazolonepropionase [candidate division KSB1 bacterium]